MATKLMAVFRDVNLIKLLSEDLRPIMARMLDEVHAKHGDAVGAVQEGAVTRTKR